MINAVRALFFWIGFLATAVPYGLLAVLLWLLRVPFRTRFNLLTTWGTFSIFWLHLTCGVRWRVIGAENITEQAGVLLANHQSTWETLFLQRLFRPQAWVLKESLLRIPFFGWGLRALDPVAIDRGQRRRALRQIVEQGSRLVEQGRWVVVFPEGTRLAAGQTRRWGTGGASLAVAARCPVIPLAHDAGRFWPRGGLVPRAGTSTITIGPPITVEGRTADEITREARNWVESHRADLPPPPR